MLAPLSASTNILQQYRKHPSSGPRELTPAMVRSIDEADKTAKRGKKAETQKEAQVSKPTKAKTPLKRKSDRAVRSPPKPKKLKKPARRLMVLSLSDSDSEYVPPQHKIATPATLVLSHPPSPPRVTIPVSIPPIFPIPTTQPFTTISIPTPIFTDTTTTIIARQAIEAANASLQANVNDRLTQLEAELAVENLIMDELDKHTSQLKMQNLKLRTATTELNDLKSEKEPKLGGEKQTREKPTQPPTEPKPSSKPKGNEASVSHKWKKKKKIGEDDTDDEDDVYAENPKNPF
ncbi:unnamed protein product [Lactuca saligna]|uniref:Uncharacterized protein n=1 Tax=Lactuca saligna TaxID=75948 RepID=A0AA35Y5T5_LACSI|nr:unnamed protein product [Lactuca saligna]